MNAVSVEALPATVRHTAVKPPIYSAHLDLLRGSAALMVMFGHLRFLFEDLGRTPLGKIAAAAQDKLVPATPPSHYMNPAHQAVILFFVLSGTLVGGSILRDQKRKKFSWVSYCSKRLARLLTVLVPALIIGGLIDVGSRHILASGPAALFGRASDIEFNFGVKNFLGNLFFLQGVDRTGIPTFGSNAPLWSLSYEFWFYVLFPLLIAVVYAKQIKSRILYIFLFVITAAFLWKGIFFALLLWSFGALVTLVPPAIPERAQRAAVGAAFALYGGIAVYLWRRPLANLVLDDYVLAFAMAVLVYVILHRREVHSKTIYTYVTEQMAQISYTLYMFHVPLVILTALFLTLYFPSVMKHHSLAYWGIACLTVCICYCLYLMFERNTDRVRSFGLKLLVREPSSER
jgi:peptidoglycan/LPS O-acetylase OafA/YrhL